PADGQHGLLRHEWGRRRPRLVRVDRDRRAGERPLLSGIRAGSMDNGLAGAVPRSSNRSILARTMGIAVAVPLVLAPLAIGTVHLGTRMVVFGLSCLALLVALLERARARRHVQLPPVVYAMALAVAATALQLIPLPASLLAILS